MLPLPCVTRPSTASLWLPTRVPYKKSDLLIDIKKKNKQRYTSKHNH